MGFSRVHSPCGVCAAAKGYLAGLLWVVWVVAFWRALWLEIIFLFQSPTIKDWFSPGSKGRQSLWLGAGGRHSFGGNVVRTPSQG